MLRIDPKSDVPPYEQLRDQLMAQIESGQLPPGARLPAVRRLAGDLGLAPNTVARTYRELERRSYVRTAGRNGTIVTEDSHDDTDPALEASRAHARALIAQGIDVDAAVRLLQRAFAELKKG